MKNRLTNDKDTPWSIDHFYMAAARLLGTTKQSHADMGRPDNVSLKSRSNYLSYNFFKKSFERNV